MTTLRPVVLATLDSLGVAKRETEGNGIRYGFKDGNAKFVVQITFPSNSEVIMYSVPSFNIPEESRKKAAEYINYKNFHTKVGCIELDMRDGEVRFRTSLRYYGEATNFEKSLQAMMALHHSYFPYEVYPQLKLLSDPNDLIPLEALIGDP